MVLIPILALAGCRPPEESAAGRSRLVLAQVIDETDFLAQAGQVEGEVLDHLLAEARTLDYITLPASALPIEQAINSPGRLRGRKVFLRGKLLSMERTMAPGQTAGTLLKGLVLMSDGGLAAFRAQVPDGATPALPEPGSAVEVIGFFMKRWVALDGSGSRYAMVPLVAGNPPIAIAGTADAEKLAGLQPAGGLLPLTELDVPPVRSRPVIEADTAGVLRLDGRKLSRRKLVAELARLAEAAPRTPLGDSALVAVVLADKSAPAAAIEALKNALPIRAVFRTQSGK